LHFSTEAVPWCASRASSAVTAGGETKTSATSYADIADVMLFLVDVEVYVLLHEQFDCHVVVALLRNVEHA
jgi:hypothetical protein